MTNPIAIVRLYRAERLRRERDLKHIRVAPNTVAANDPGHKPHSIFTRAALFFTPERADYLIGAGCIVGMIVAFGWSLLDWMTLQGWR